MFSGAKTEMLVLNQWIIFPPSEGIGVVFLAT